MLQQKLLRKVLTLLEENQIDYMLTGSLVSSMQGEPRASHDIDIIVNISVSGGSEKQFHDALMVFEVQHSKLDLPYGMLG